MFRHMGTHCACVVWSSEKHRTTSELFQPVISSNTPVTATGQKAEVSMFSL